MSLEPLEVWKVQLVARHFLFWIVESPQSVRQKIREARKPDHGLTSSSTQWEGNPTSTTRFLLTGYETVCAILAVERENYLRARTTSFAGFVLAVVIGSDISTLSGDESEPPAYF